MDSLEEDIELRHVVGNAWDVDTLDHAKERQELKTPIESPCFHPRAPAVIGRSISSSSNITGKKSPAGTDMHRNLQYTTEENIQMWDVMKEREQDRSEFDFSAPYIQYRRIVVEWMCEVAEEFRLCPAAVHLSIVYFDTFLQKTSAPVQKANLQLVAMACTLIAAKFQGPEETVPRLQDLNSCSNNTYTVDLIIKMEVTVLNVIQWRTDILTAFHFTDHILSVGAVFYSDMLKGELLFENEDYNKNDKIPKKLRHFSEFFVRICLEDQTFCKYKASEVAVSALAAARYILDLRPVWPITLYQMTGSELNKECITTIIWNCNRRFPDHFPRVPEITDSELSPKYASPRGVYELNNSICIDP